MSHWRINMLGPFEVLDPQGEPLETARGRCEELLALQALYFCDPELGPWRLGRLSLVPLDGRPSHRRLAAQILHGATNRLEIGQVDQTCRLLRGRSGAPRSTEHNPFGPILRGDSGIHGLISDCVETDVDLFERAVTKSEGAAQEGDERLWYLWQAVQQYRGQFLDGFPISRWLSQPRVQYIQTYKSTLRALAEYSDDSELKNRCLAIADRGDALSADRPTLERVRAVIDARLGPAASRYSPHEPEVPVSPRYVTGIPERDDAFALSVLQPDPQAEEVSSRSRLVVGNVIECYAHSSLQNYTLSLADLGWATHQIHLIDLQEEFDARPFMEKAQPPRHPRSLPPNNIKLMLAGIPGGATLDGEKELWIHLRRTSFFEVNDTANFIPDHPDIRREFGRVDPENNQIPHSINLEHIARLSDGHVLCWFRKGTAVHDRVFGFTGEEQLKLEEDFGPPDPMTRWMRRTYLEEVLPLKGGNYDERWRRYGEPTLRSMRVWTIFLEEANWNFDLLGVFDMRLTLQEYVEESTRIRLAETSQWDREGDPYAMSHEEVMRLLATGSGQVFDPFKGADESTVVVTEDQLHRSSRYRLFRLMRALYRLDFIPELKRIRARAAKQGTP